MYIFHAEDSPLRSFLGSINKNVGIPGEVWFALRRLCDEQMAFENEAEWLINASLGALRSVLSWERQPLKTRSDIVAQTRKIASLASKLERALLVHHELGGSSADYWQPEDFERVVSQESELHDDKAVHDLQFAIDIYGPTLTSLIAALRDRAVRAVDHYKSQLARRPQNSGAAATMFLQELCMLLGRRYPSKPASTIAMIVSGMVGTAFDDPGVDHYEAAKKQLQRVKTVRLEERTQY